jgi:hypothetical protein
LDTKAQIPPDTSSTNEKVFWGLKEIEGGTKKK